MPYLPLVTLAVGVLLGACGATWAIGEAHRRRHAAAIARIAQTRRQGMAADPTGPRTVRLIPDEPEPTGRHGHR